MSEQSVEIQKYRGFAITTKIDNDVCHHIIAKEKEVMVDFRLVGQPAGRIVVTCDDGRYSAFANRVLDLECNYLDCINMEYVFSKKTFDYHFSWVLRRVIEHIVKEEKEK